MSKEQTAPLPSAIPDTIARLFSKLGWIGFWVQVGLVILPLIMLIVVVTSSTPGVPPLKRFDLWEYLGFGSLLVLLFTMFWSYRYTRLAKRMLTPGQHPSSSSIVQNLWVGILAGNLGAFISLVLLHVSVGRLLFLFMNAPQGGMQVIQTSFDDRAKWVSTIDMLDLMTMVVSLTAEFIVVVLSLWLLYRTLRWGADYDRVLGASASLEQPRENVPVA